MVHTRFRFAVNFPSDKRKNILKYVWPQSSYNGLYFEGCIDMPLISA